MATTASVKNFSRSAERREAAPLGGRSSRADSLTPAPYVSGRPGGTTHTWQSGRMPTPPLPDDVRAKLAEPNPAVMATVRSDGAPVTAATWYLLDGDRILVNFDHSRVRLKHVRHDPRVALTVLDQESWYTHISIVGTVVEIRPDEGWVDIDRLSQHYGGRPYPDHESPRVSAWIEIERWHGWGAARTD